MPFFIFLLYRSPLLIPFSKIKLLETDKIKKKVFYLEENIPYSYNLSPRSGTLHDKLFEQEEWKSCFHTSTVIITEYWIVNIYVGEHKSDILLINRFHNKCKTETNVKNTQIFF